MDGNITQAMQRRNQAIIDAVLKKAQKVCPHALALIGINGSFRTGDLHEKSDLDLLIVINSPKGRCLSAAFVCDGIGQDLYCTTWEALEQEAAAPSPRCLAKLMDAAIVYAAKPKYLRRLHALRREAAKHLSGALDPARFENANRCLREALCAYGRMMLSEELSACRSAGAAVMEQVENGICLLNQTYFKLGVRRTLDEIAGMERKPEHCVNLLARVAEAESLDEIKCSAGKLLRETSAYFAMVEESLRSRERPSAENLRGAYEEIYSNWRNKMRLSAQEGDRYLALMTLKSCQDMFDELHRDLQIDRYDVLSGYDPQALEASAIHFDQTLALF